MVISFRNIREKTRDKTKLKIQKRKKRFQRSTVKNNNKNESNGFVLNLFIQDGNKNIQGEMNFAVVTGKVQ